MQWPAPGSRHTERFRDRVNPFDMPEGLLPTAFTFPKRRPYTMTSSHDGATPEPDAPFWRRKHPNAVPHPEACALTICNPPLRVAILQRSPEHNTKGDYYVAQ